MKLPALVSVVVAALVAVPLLTVNPAPAGAGHSWSTYHWGRISNSFTLQVLDNMTENPPWDTHLEAAVGDWDTSSVLDLALIADWSEDGRKRCSAVSGKVRACNDRYGFNGWLGIAQVWVSGGHIVQAVTKMNDSYFNTSTYNTPAWRRFVVCQEIGHAFGLGHQDEGFGPPNLGTCMDYTNDPDGGGDYGPSNERPDAHDYEQLETIYNSHTDGTNTVSSSAASTARGWSGTAADEGPNNPAEFGRPTGDTDGRGRENLFVEDLPGGLRRFTHVYWAQPGSPGAPGAPNRP